jgi:hypothetical protein
MAAQDAKHTTPVTEGCDAGAVVIGFAANDGCARPATESDPHVMCDSGVQFIRHIVKVDGVPTGEYTDTDLTGASYTVTDEAAVAVGECKTASVCAPNIGSATADDLTSLPPGQTISVQKPACCRIKLKTSAGDVILAKDVQGFSTDKFDCNVTVTGVEILSGTCDPADIIVTTQTSLPLP